MAKGYFKINKEYFTEDELHKKYAEFDSIPDIKIYYDCFGTEERSMANLICSLRENESIYITTLEDLGLRAKSKCEILYAFSVCNCRFFINKKEFDLSDIAQIIENGLKDSDGNIKTDSTSLEKLNNILKRFQS